MFVTGDFCIVVVIGFSMVNARFICFPVLQQGVCYRILGSPYQSVAAGGNIFRVPGHVCCRRTKIKTRRVFRYGGAQVKTHRM